MKQITATPKLKLSKFQKLFFVVALPVAFLIIILFGASHLVQNNNNDKTGSLADRHAQTAGTVMQQVTAEVPTGEAAYEVVGSTGSSPNVTTIDALKAEGSTSNGEVILRIIVSDDNGPLGADESSQRCYAYHFNHSANQLLPQKVNCSNIPPIKLLTPPPDPINPKTAP